MRRSTVLITIGAAAVGALAADTWRARRHASDIATALGTPAGPERFDESMLDGLPGPALRWLRSAIAPGTLLAHTVELDGRGSMIPSPGKARMELSMNEVLGAGRGLVWRAHAKAGPIALDVTDTYVSGRASLDARALGVVPVMHAGDADVAHSSRHRVAGESMWVPASLLPIRGATWRSIDEERAECTITVDREDIPVTVRVAHDGDLEEVTMLRHGDVGVDSWQLIPYGFRCEESQTFGGYRIPSRIRGGWWYGTDRYNEATASEFEVHHAVFD